MDTRLCNFEVTLSIEELNHLFVSSFIWMQILSIHTVGVKSKYKVCVTSFAMNHRDKETNIFQ